MPTSKKDQGDIEIILEDENSDETVFKFKPFGLLGLKKAIKDDPTISFKDFQEMQEYIPSQEEMAELSDEEVLDIMADIPDHLPDQVEIGDAIFRGAMERCTSHIIVDRDYLDDIILDPLRSEQERKRAKELKEMADYYMDNFSHKEQSQILKEVIKEDEIEEGMKEAGNFRGDK